MRTKNSFLLRAISLLVLLALMLPAGTGTVGALPLAAPPPVDMFQLPWDLGKAWVALDDATSPLLPFSYQAVGVAKIFPLLRD